VIQVLVSRALLPNPQDARYLFCVTTFARVSFSFNTLAGTIILSMLRSPSWQASSHGS
jgi:hypothetical protein